MVEPSFDALHEYMTTHFSKPRSALSRIIVSLMSGYLFVLV